MADKTKRVKLGVGAGRFAKHYAQVPSRYRGASITEEDVVFDAAIKILGTLEEVAAKRGLFRKKAKK